MELAVAEVAERLGVGVNRVYDMLRAGELHGRQASGVWLLDEAQLLKPRKLGRPMSPRIAWAVILGATEPGWSSAHHRVDVAWLPQASPIALHRVDPSQHGQHSPSVALRRVDEAKPDPMVHEGREPDWLRQDERSRLRRRVERLHDDPNAAHLLATWLAARADPVNMSAPEPEALYADPDLVPSGVSDPRSGMVGGHGAEFYAQPDSLPGVIRRHLLVPDPNGQVLLRQSPVHLEAPVPILLVAADLADRGRPREMRRAAELIADWAHA
jgi:hypothetical protein